MNLRLADRSPGSVVLLKEYGIEKEYIVLKHGYPVADNGRTLLLRKMLIDNVLWSYSNNEYANSNVDSYLNYDFIFRFDNNIRSNIAEVEIPYCIGNGTDNVTTLSRKIFLLSGTEVGYSDDYMAVEGEAIPYFGPIESYVAYLDNDPEITGSWWLRSPKTNSTSDAWSTAGIDPSYGPVDNTNVFVRPAFTLPSSMLINSCIITLASPMTSSELITKAVLYIARSIPGDADFKIEVTNNANDPEPVWEDATKDVLFGRNHVFSNTVATHGYAFNFRISANRGPGGESGYIFKVEGAFE